MAVGILLQHRPVELVTTDYLSLTQEWAVTQRLDCSVAKAKTRAIYLRANRDRSHHAVLVPLKVAETRAQVHQAAALGIDRQALILVGNALGTKMGKSHRSFLYRKR